MTPEIAHWFAVQWHLCARRFIGAYQNTRTGGWRHHSRHRDYWSFIACCAGTVRILDYLADGFGSGILPLRPIRPVADWPRPSSFFMPSACAMLPVS